MENLNQSLDASKEIFEKKKIIISLSSNKNKKHTLEGQ